MSKVQLPSVTLCAVDCLNPELALRAIDLCSLQCEFAEVLFLSDSADQYRLDGCRMVTIPKLASRAEYSHFVIKQLGTYLRTEYMLLVQWDGYIMNPQSWRPEFLEYDYIGAPWGWYQDAHRVGNGGFSLRSRRLFDALLDADITEFEPEDEAIGRRYRTLLEQKYSIRFPADDIAEAFSFETTYPKGRPFGFHGLFNMWSVIPAAELEKFVATLVPSSVKGPQFLQLGRNYLELGRKEEAAVVLRRRLKVVADDAEAGRLLAQAAQSSIGTQPDKRVPGRNDPCPCGSGKRYKQCCGAAAAGMPATTPAPELPTTLLQQAMRLHQAGQLAEAESAYHKVIALEPQNAIALQYLGVLAMQRNDPRQGESLIRSALAIRSDIPDFHNNLGLCLRLQNRFVEAQACYRQAIALQPDYLPAYNNLGLDLQATNAIPEAIDAYRQAIRLQPQFAEAHWNLGLACLLQGKYAEGWKEYEWRLRCQPFLNDGLVLDQASPWQGQPLAGKTLLVRREQGAGDSIQFIRFVPLLLKQGAHVLLDIKPDLAELGSRLLSGVEILDRSQSPGFDYYVNLLSLPHWLGIELDNLSATIPYLDVDAVRAAGWRDRLAGLPGKKVGVVWAGNPKHSNDRNRSCPLDALSLLFRLPGITWLSLQKGEAVAQLVPYAGQVINLDPELQSYADTAAVLTHLDLLIAVDTSVAHLAGALGVPTWVMLPYAPDWRWLLGREDTPWYPDLRLFRQEETGDWFSVVNNLDQSLLRLV